MTKVTIQKQDKRGGHRVPTTLTGQGLLLKFLWERFGGIVECGKMLGLSPEQPLQLETSGWSTIRNGRPSEQNSQGAQGRA